MPITIGMHLGSHEITALHRKGGMGEVYRARDTKLKREVGIKILPEEFSRDADRVDHFQREVDVLASLNHPNICRKVPRAVRGRCDVFPPRAACCSRAMIRSWRKK